MKKLIILLLSTLITSPLWANISVDPLVNKVSLRLRAETWVTTKTALVNVIINAAVSDQGIDKIQTSVMQKLSQLINNVSWHIVSFDRQQDQSGLESIQITAQARVPQTELGNLRDKAKNLSKPGETYKIDSVQFTPSEEELQQANSVLRNSIYQQAKNEIDVLNKNYPDQKYYLHQIDFNMPPMVPMERKMYGNQMAAMAAPMPANGSPLSVGNKQELVAYVVLAAMPDQVTQFLNKSATVAPSAT